MQLSLASTGGQVQSLSALCRHVRLRCSFLYRHFCTNLSDNPDVKINYIRSDQSRVHRSQNAVSAL